MSGGTQGHVTNVYVIETEDNQYVKGDPFWPELTERIDSAARQATMSDAKKYIKTAEKRLKPKQKLHATACEAVYDSSFNLKEIKKV